MDTVWIHSFGKLAAIYGKCRRVWFCFLFSQTSVTFRLNGAPVTGCHTNTGVVISWQWTIIPHCLKMLLRCPSRGSWTSHQKSKRTARVNLLEKMGGNKASVVYWKESQIHTVLGAQLCCFDSTGTGPHPLATQLSQPYMCFPVSSLPNTMRWRRWQQLSLFFHNHWPTWPRNTVYWTPPRTQPPS